jgi:diketogulonate reductase-like aldo/keto reductase
MIKDEFYTLTNGIRIPKVGLGTWQSSKEDAYNATLIAIKNGYRHIDTAFAYQNEDAVGKAIRDSKIDRKDIFVTTKLPAQYKTYQEAIDYFNASLSNLGLDYIDLYLIHAPWPWSEVGKDCEEGNIEVWKAFIDLYNSGKVKAIGVSNFRPNNIENLIKATKFVPHVNQIRYFIGNTQKEVVDYCKEHNILVEAYSPLATGEILNSPELDNIANKYNKTKAQICLRYCLENKTLPLPKSVHEERICANLNLDFKIDKEDLNYLDSLTIGSRRPLRS